MATETVTTDHTSSTDEQFEKKENQEASGQNSVPLSNEDEDKRDKPVDAQDLATPSSNTEEILEGDKKNAEAAAVEVEKRDDSSPLEAFDEDNNNPEHDKVEDAKGSLAPISKTEEAKEDKDNAEPAVVEENLKEEKELNPDSESISVTEPAHDADKSQPESTEPTVKETPQKEEEEQSKIAEPIEKSSNNAAGNPVTESEAEVVKEAETLETSSQNAENPETLVTKVHKETEEPEKESQGKAQGADQLDTVAVTEDSTETSEKRTDAIDEKAREPEPETEKAEPVVIEVEENPKEPEKQPTPTETEKAETLVTEVEKNPKDLEKQSGPKLEAGPSEKAEPLVSEAGENPKEPEEQTYQKAQEEQSTTAAIPEPPTDTNDEIREPKLEVGPTEIEKAEVVKEAETLETSSQKAKNPETVVTEVHKETEEPEREYQGKAQGADQLDAVGITEDSPDTNEKLSDAAEEKTRELEPETEKAEPVVTEVEKNPKELEKQSGPTETEKAEPVVSEADENPKEPEKQPAPKETEKAEPLVTEVEKSSKELEKQSGPTETERAEPEVSEAEENPIEPEEQTYQRAQEEHPTTAALPQPSTDTNDEIREPKLEAGPTETEKAEPVVAKVGETPSQPEEPSLKQEVEKLPVEIPESSTDKSDATESRTREPELDAESLGKTHSYEAGPSETENAEPMVTEGRVIPSEPGTPLFEQAKEKELVANPDPSAETSDAMEEKTRSAELEAEVLVEKTRAKSTETEKSEPVVAKVGDIPNQPEEPSFERMKEEQPVAIPESSAETSDVIEGKTREAEVLVEKTREYEAGPTETEKVEPPVAKVGGSQSQTEEPSFKQEEEEQLKTVIPEMASESAEKPGDAIEIHPPKESDIEAVKEIDNSEPEAEPVKAEKPELPSTGEKPKEQLVVAEEVGETGKDVETKEKSVLETAKNEGTSYDTTKDSISLEEEKTAQVSIHAEAQAAPTNVEGEGRKDPSFADVAEGVTKEVVGVLENPEQASIDQNAKPGLQVKTDSSAPTTIEEKVATNDEKRELEAPNTIEGTSREAEVIIKKVEENNEGKIATTEAKVEEIATAVGEPVRETLASKLEEKNKESLKTGVDNLEKEQKEETVKTEVQIAEQPTKESDATKTSKEVPKETPAKPAQKQSNNLMSKVKQSLVKAKKAITGKSPSSKNVSSEAKGDIKVK